MPPNEAATVPAEADSLHSARSTPVPMHRRTTSLDSKATFAQR